MTLSRSLFRVSDRVWRREILAAGHLTLLTLGLCITVAYAAPYVPENGSDIIAELPQRDGIEWQEIASLRARLVSDPDSAPIAARLVQSYLELFRVEGDPRLLGYATAVLIPWKTLQAPPHSIALQRAVLAELQHRFEDAAGELENMLRIEPRDVQAGLSLASLHLVTGKHEQARAACARLLLMADSVTAGSCLAAVNARTDRRESAYAFLTSDSAIAAVRAEPDLAIWINTLAAETAAALGDQAAADAHFRAALETTRSARRRPNTYLLATYADLLLADDRAASALNLLSDAPASDPILLRRARAMRQLGQLADNELDVLRYRLRDALSEQDLTHAREAAYFLLYVEQDANRALSAARSNWSVQREPIDALLVIESAARICAVGASMPVTDWIEANRFTHAEFVEPLHRLAQCR